jgi:hypothetical protein
MDKSLSKKKPLATDQAILREAQTFIPQSDSHDLKLRHQTICSLCNIYCTALTFIQSRLFFIGLHELPSVGFVSFCGKTKRNRR